jgi:NTE family protein
MPLRLPALARLCACAALFFLAACASPVRTTELARIDQHAGYRYATLDQAAPKTIDKSAIIMSFSGGGTRAAALADGALRALAATPVRGTAGPVPLASQIDVISSVSGGSVTAAFFALSGIDGLAGFEQNFLYSNVMDALITRTLLHPWQLFQPRIDILDDYLDDEVFHRKTYADLIAAQRPGGGRRPYVILNAADMAGGNVFSFTQDQFDLICGDLQQLRIAHAVSASAAFPVALSALTIRNRAPCPAQLAAPEVASTGWRRANGFPEPLRIINDRAAPTERGVAFPAAENLARFRRGTASLSYLNRDNGKDYIHLLDGGIADNLGLTMPITLLTSPGESPAFRNWLNTGRVDKLLFVVVNARSQSGNDFGSRARPPGTFDTLKTTIGTPIDATSFQLLSRLDDMIDERFNPKSLVLVDFDFIADPGCRAHFHNIATSWSLPAAQVDELIALGEAMVLQSPRYRAFVAALGATPPAPRRSVDQICAPYNSAVKTAARDAG